MSALSFTSSSACRNGAGSGSSSVISDAEVGATGLRAGGFFSSLEGVAMAQKNAGGRPAGEVRRALLHAAIELNMGDRAATLRELARAACVGHSAARIAVVNMRRAGVLSVVRTRSVAYRNRPVAEYAPLCELPAGNASADSSLNFSALQRAWA